MVVDSSALVAILFAEPEAGTFLQLLTDGEDVLISAATLVEASIVMHGRTGDGGVADLDDLLEAAGVRVVAVDAAQAGLAREAFKSYGKGQGSGAGLNFGDCFAYALAMAESRPLLFKGSDFSRTDVESAAA